MRLAGSVSKCGTSWEPCPCIHSGICMWGQLLQLHLSVTCMVHGPTVVSKDFPRYWEWIFSLFQDHPKAEVVVYWRVHLICELLAAAGLQGSANISLAFCRDFALSSSLNLSFLWFQAGIFIYFLSFETAFVLSPFLISMITNHTLLFANARSQNSLCILTLNPVCPRAGLP